MTLSTVEIHSELPKGSSPEDATWAMVIGMSFAEQFPRATRPAGMAGLEIYNISPDGGGTQASVCWTKGGTVVVRIAHPESA